MIKEILLSAIGSICFAITMRVPKGYLRYAWAGALLSAIIYTILAPYGELISCMLSMVCLCFYCELMARILKIPAIIMLMPSTIPLLPGSAIYYAMLYLIGGNQELFTGYLTKTIYAGVGISLGAVISTIFIKLLGRTQ